MLGCRYLICKPGSDELTRSPRRFARRARGEHEGDEQTRIFALRNVAQLFSFFVSFDSALVSWKQLRRFMTKLNARYNPLTTVGTKNVRWGIVHHASPVYMATNNPRYRCQLPDGEIPALGYSYVSVVRMGIRWNSRRWKLIGGIKLSAMSENGRRFIHDRE